MTNTSGDRSVHEAHASFAVDGDQPFNEREMDKIIRQIVDKVRGNYFQNGETGRGIPAEVKRIIEANIDRV
jgi:hypothetical protein